LLVSAREEYDWPTGTGSAQSQARVFDLENTVSNLKTNLTPANAINIVSSVSIWGGNNKKAQKDIEATNPNNQAKIVESILQMANLTTLREGLNALSYLPGLRLIMSTKVFRFCYPEFGAAVDRHASYFFNSISAMSATGAPLPLTDFRREWATGNHNRSRLAIYQLNNHNHNLNVFTENYLPLLTKIANNLNDNRVTFTCAATGALRRWRPADVEMAAYFWWSQNGAS
jgi:hypothetical protein